MINEDVKTDGKFLNRNAQCIGAEYAEGGTSLHKYVAYKYDGKLYIVEYHPTIVNGKEETNEVIKILDY